MRWLTAVFLGLAVAWAHAAHAQRGAKTADAKTVKHAKSRRAAAPKGKKSRRSGKQVAPKRSAASCLRALERLGVRHRPVKRRGIDIAVRVSGAIGGVTYRGYGGKPLVLDCSLVVSLAQLGPQMTALGITRATYSSAYQRRRVRDSDRWSKHSFGLALDVHSFAGDELGTLTVRDDYEQGLGATSDCLGRPLTRGGALLRTLHCELEGSGMFHSVLTPDYDAGHYNHYHLEADPWQEREFVAPRPKVVPPGDPGEATAATR